MMLSIFKRKNEKPRSACGFEHCHLATCPLVNRDECPIRRAWETKTNMPAHWYRAPKNNQN